MNNVYITIAAVLFIMLCLGLKYLISQQLLWREYQSRSLSDAEPVDLVCLYHGKGNGCSTVVIPRKAD